GPLDALCKSLCAHFKKDIEIVSYQEHDLEGSSRSRAVTYICVKEKDSDRLFWGAGINENINTSSIYAFISAVNKLLSR
ncbi:MAG: 2-isopropylmalate synthase, partial [Oscillospiraceae bacterium]|nr:2-isopropylmalate synthase [Oscillospiraceae bacterium]